jgi:predicted Holliday junction resolvase-like endonuclease
MKSSILIIIIGLIVLNLSNCSKETTIQFEKEKFKYQNRMDSVVTNLDRKIAEFEARNEETQKIAEEEENRELAEPKSATDSLEQIITQMEQLKENLNKKLGELEYSTKDNWSQLKSEIDLLLKEYNQSVDKGKSEESPH